MRVVCFDFCFFVVGLNELVWGSRNLKVKDFWGRSEFGIRVFGLVIFFKMGVFFRFYI